MTATTVTLSEGALAALLALADQGEAQWRGTTQGRANCSVSLHT